MPLAYGGNFPDPFVLRFNGRYYAYGTSPNPVTAPGQPAMDDCRKDVG